MKQLKLILISLLALPIIASAQYYYDGGVKLGMSNYVGEIGGKEKEGRPWLLDMKIPQTRADLGFFFRYRLKQNIGINASFERITIRGADSLSTNPARVGRNLSFRNNMYELAVRGEYYFYTQNDVGGSGRYQLDMRAYGFIGAAGFYSNPKAYYNGSWEALQPLQTEGVKYSRLNFAIPFGVGLFYTYKRQHRFGWEFNVRKTFTDYLDDVSTVYAEHEAGSTAEKLSNRYTGNNTDIDPLNYGYSGTTAYDNPRGDPSDKDWYLTSAVSYSFVFRGKKSFVKSRYNYTYGGKKHKRRTRAKF